MSAAAFPPAGYPEPPGPIASGLFERYVRRQAGRHFAGVHWSARALPDRWDLDVPTVFIANHTNWWDGFLAFLVARSLGLGFQVLMEARHLDRYRTFLRLGALPLRRDRPREAYADLTAAVAYLRPRVGLWVFPQGARRPPSEPVAGSGRGAAHLALAYGRALRFCPVAFRYGFVGEQLPEAFVLVGEEWVYAPGPNRSARRAPLMAGLERRLSATVDALDRLVREERFAEFEPLAAGRLSVNKRLDRFRHAVGLLGGRFEARNG
jgi:1-acyl-sn-glycerol-3-phosphate acyltransferase